ncbi:PASTA domain-containing protein [Paenibacillus xerothermodurans]|uniref:PASTA domain-containing protein n=1 Tax=Paenibacillus xerothermodurans TaxID=1977292 RepID=A0A2W1NBS6_PAEXE|nr:PASTA domain-containing protein [Paenibacillus xerothermodurans]PZE22119.1 PASTA domain-containing protein [Paenibacillus xerothermodurans]
MKSISNRYVLAESIARLNGGVLHKAQDLSLERTVLIYMLPYRGELTRKNYLVGLGNAVEKSAQAKFMQVLDAVFDDTHIYVILKHQGGQSLKHVIERNSFDFKDASSIIADFGETLSEANEERPIDFSLSAENLWLGDDRRVCVINWWDKVGGNRRLAKPLSILLYQLLTHNEKAPSDIQVFESQLQRVARDLDPAQRATAVNVLSNAYKERLPVVSFIQCLKDLRSGLPLEADMDAVPAAQGTAAAAPMASRPAEPGTDRRAGTSTRRAAELAMRRATPPVTSKAAEPTASQTYETSDDDGAEPTPAKKIVGRVFATASLGLLSLAVFVAVFAMLVNFSGNDDDPQSSAIASNSKPAPDADQKPTQPSQSAQPAEPAQPDDGTEQAEPDRPMDPAQPPETDAENSPPQEAPLENQEDSAAPDTENGVSVPTLTGLSKEAAEQQALSSGLKYTFYLEENPEAQGTVFRQDPLPNSPAAKGDHVTFWVSKGTKS